MNLPNSSPDEFWNTTGRGWRTRGAAKWGRRFYQRASRTQLLTYRFWLWVMLSTILDPADPRRSLLSQADVERLVGPLCPM